MALPLAMPKNFKHNFFSLIMFLWILLLLQVLTKMLSLVLVVDPTQVEVDLANSKKRKNIYEMNRRFQNSWVAKLPWAKFVVCVDGKITQVKCKACIVIEGRNKLLVLKLDFFVETCWPKEVHNCISGCGN